MRYVIVFAVLIWATKAIGGENFRCLETHGKIMGTSDSGDFFNSDLQSNDIRLTVDDDGSLLIFDKSGADTVIKSSSQSETSSLRRWAFGQSGLVSLIKGRNKANMQDLIYLNFHSLGQIGMMRRYNCFPD